MPAGELGAPAALPADPELVALAVAESPLVRSLGAAVAERRALVELADREAIPTLSVGLSFAREGAAGSPASYIGLATLGVAIPVWDANTRIFGFFHSPLGKSTGREPSWKSRCQS